jgi:putative membrane protein
MMWGDGWNMSWMWLFGLLLLVGITLLIVLAVRAFGGGIRSGGGSEAASPSRARQILDERFAKGELTAEQYREQVRVLREAP